MSETQSPSSSSGAADDSRGIVLSAAFLGILIGAAGTFVGVYSSGYRLEKPDDPAAVTSHGNAAPAPGGAPPMAGPPAGMGMPGGMMGMGGMGGGGGGARGKRNLTQLVGKLELLTRGKLDVALSPDQTLKVSAMLAELDQAEKMTADEAQSHLDALEGVLTPEQKEIVESIGLPGGGRGGRGGGGGMGGGMMGMGGGGPPEDENPFKQEANQKRLEDLLTRIKPAGSEPVAPATNQ